MKISSLSSEEKNPMKGKIIFSDDLKYFFPY